MSSKDTSNELIVRDEYKSLGDIMDSSDFNSYMYAHAIGDYEGDYESYYRDVKSGKFNGDYFARACEAKRRKREKHEEIWAAMEEEVDPERKAELRKKAWEELDKIESNED